MSSACRVRAITDPSSLEGTAYGEVMAGPYANRCWNDGSLFFEEEVFGYIEPTIERFEPTYDHYAFTQISMLDWEKIVKALADVRSRLEVETFRPDMLQQIGFLFADSKERFTQSMNANCAALGAMISQIETWTSDNRLRHSCVTILGL
ncbi:hypothetical protein LMG9964_04084 [Paraburkholderia phenoliruptrix]|uniref:Uncharacterized protein n=3 Tax=Paraburkholderia phenoliruptrix TaxID=252970 RepID=A0A6J5K981_9BURK|nr:hypothetical protein LMG9964_04084 [Paraburkholderia phenoliruptrix]